MPCSPTQGSLKIAMELCELQLQFERCFMFKHPLHARGWTTPEVIRVMDMEGVRRAQADLCWFGMQSTTEIGTASAKKPTGFLTTTTTTSPRGPQLPEQALHS